MTARGEEEEEEENLARCSLFVVLPRVCCRQQPYRPTGVCYPPFAPTSQHQLRKYMLESTCAFVSLANRKGHAPIPLPFDSRFTNLTFLDACQAGWCTSTWTSAVTFHLEA